MSKMSDLTSGIEGFLRFESHPLHYNFGYIGRFLYVLVFFKMVYETVDRFKGEKIQLQNPKKFKIFFIFSSQVPQARLKRIQMM